MTYYVSFTNSGFIGVSPFPVSMDNLQLGIMVDTINGDIPDMNNVTWDNDNHVLTATTKPVLTKLDFLSRFTTQERIAINNSTDPIVIDAMNLLSNSSFIDVLDQRTMQLVGYLAMTGIILNSRVAEILI